MSVGGCIGSYSYLVSTSTFSCYMYKKYRTPFLDRAGTPKNILEYTHVTITNLSTRIKVSLYTSHSLSRGAEESNKSPGKKEGKKKKTKTQEDQIQGEKGEKPTPVRDRTPAYHRTLGQERTARKHMRQLRGRNTKKKREMKEGAG